MRRPLKMLGLAFVGIFVAVQLLPLPPTSPPFDPATSLERSMPLPAPVKAILDRSCRDCHTNETRWPGYGYVAPASWLLARDVDEGRENLNFSEWGLLDTDSQRDSLIEICRKVTRGEMPLKTYTWIHRAARLAPDDVKT